FCALAMAGGQPGVWAHCRFCRLVPAPQWHRVWRAARAERQDASLLPADVCAPGAGFRRRHLPASGFGGLVPERRKASGLSMPSLINTIVGRSVDEHRRCPRLVVDEEQWRLIARELAAGRYVLLGLWED